MVVPTGTRYTLSGPPRRGRGATANVSVERVPSATDTELVLPSRQPRVYVAWATWFERDPATGGVDAESPSTWTGRFLARVAIPSVREQATAAEAAGATA